MITITKTRVDGFSAAIRGMRNPMESWNKSDSKYNNLKIGENDLKLMKKLVLAGTDHSKFMRMINVTCDIDAPIYWWKEFDTYKVATVRNSCSTMHKIHAKEFELSDFSTEHLDKVAVKFFESIIDVLNYYRTMFINTKHKDWWWHLIQLLPSSYNQKATVQLNYATLRNMYFSRKDHKLDEWHKFCDWIKTLPYSEIIMIEKE